MKHIFSIPRAHVLIRANTHTLICADDITLLAPSRASMVLMLEKCESFALTHDILFNASKTL